MKNTLLRPLAETWLCSVIGDYRKDDLENSHKNDVFLTSPWLIQTPILHRQYLVLVPSQLYAKVPEKACVMLNDLNETVTVNLILEYAMQTRTLLSDVVTKNSFYCRPFTVSIIHWDMGAH